MGQPAHVKIAGSHNRLLYGAIGIGAIAVLEAATGLLAHSLALLGDSGHLLTDVATLVLTWWAMRQGHRRATARHTYGFHRGEILAATVNAALLLAVTAAVVIGSFLRLGSPTAVSTTPVLVVAFLALIVNVAIVVAIQGTGPGLGIKAVLLHAATDALGSVTVIVSSLLIILTGYERFDAIASLIIACLIAAGAYRILKTATAVLLEATPGDIRTEQIQTLLLAQPGIIGLHDLHVWSLDTTHRALSAHLVLSDMTLAQADNILVEIGQLLCQQFQIDHTTLQPESASCIADPPLYCNLEQSHMHTHPA